MFDALSGINTRPPLYDRITTADLWTDPHISAGMLACHLDPDRDAASYRTEFVERSVAWIRDRFALGPGRSVLDLGCGPGVYANRLALTGAAVTGLDLSARSLDHARRSAPQGAGPVRYLQRDYLTHAEDVTHDLAVMIMRDFGALQPADRARLLDVVRAHLAPGGRFLFDVDSPAAFDAVREQAYYARDLHGGFYAPRPSFGFHNTFRYEAEQVSLDRYVIVRPEGTRTHAVWVRYYSPDTLAAELAGRGFEVVEVLGDVAGAGYDEAAPSFAVVVAP